MTLNVEKFDEIVHLTILDPDMKIFDKIDNMLLKNELVKKGKRSFTPETPLYEFEFKNIPFYLMIDEEFEETFISIHNEYDYNVIKNLIEQSV